MPNDVADKDGRAGAAALAAVAARNLQLRIASGLVMVAVSLTLVYAGPGPFALLVLGVCVVMSWEWGHLVRGTSSDAGFIVHAVAVGAALALTAAGQPALAVCALIAGSLVIVPMSWGQRSGMSSLGVLYVGLPAVAMVWLRHDLTHGFAAVLFLLLVVWTTDTMAFVFGRAIGGAKLWPAVSPNKTWAGFLGGVGSSALVSSIFALSVSGAQPFRLALIGLLLGIVAQGGDLAESALKRAFGVKDASSLIPGHGGVMDRMDGVVTVAIAVAILALYLNAAAPATALLIGG